MLSQIQNIFLTIAALFYIAAGSLHFARPGMYLRMMPPYIPWHLAMVYLSGAAEILGGIGLLIRGVRREAAWGLAALLIAVFPANIYILTNPVEAGAASIPRPILWARLPLQLLLILWAVWCSRLGNVKSAALTRPSRRPLN